MNVTEYCAALLCEILPVSQHEAVNIIQAFQQSRQEEKEEMIDSWCYSSYLKFLPTEGKLLDNKVVALASSQIFNQIWDLLEPRVVS